MNKFRTLKADEIDVRVSQINAKGCALLLYKNARVDMDLLDETVGPLNWKRHHSRDNANCTVSIYDSDKGEWISKEDTGTESNTEAEKGLASDSFKRACVNWGIGRELYTAPFVWIKAGSVEIEDGYGGKKKTNDKFSVKAIEYDENRRICKLVISNDRKNKIVFDWVSGNPPVFAEEAKVDIKATPVAKAKISVVSDITKCEICGEPLSDFIGKDGEIIPASEAAKITIGKTGKCRCQKCFDSWRLVMKNNGGF